MQRQGDAVITETGNVGVSLDDKYIKDCGRVLLTGIQALVRLPLVQRRRDRQAGLNTAGFISGYRGSPLSGYDRELDAAARFLKADDITFVPGLNEDLAATHVWGSQHVTLFGKALVDGVFSLWYGKNPGLDRSCDAIKNANYDGTSKLGGVIAVIGDDPEGKSSTVANQCEYACMGLNMPVLNPANVQDLLDFGVYGWAMSRFSGCWVGLKVDLHNMDRTEIVSVDPDRVRLVAPADFDLPPDGVHVRWPDTRAAQEARLLDFKLKAVQAFARANHIDRVEFERQGARFGIVTAGKSYLDTRQALDDLGIDEPKARELGLTLYKVGLTWPLDPIGAKRVVEGLEEVLVVEEKQPVIEGQLQTLLYGTAESRRPRIVGKTDEAGRALLSPKLGLDPVDIAIVIAERLLRIQDDDLLRIRLKDIQNRRQSAEHHPTDIFRSPYFCSGCPNNSSQRVPEGSRSQAGVGCHFMSVWIPEFKTEPSPQMGGEGAFWIGQAPFQADQHVFANVGDGTYAHSASLSIRAAVAAGANMTFKVLYNDAVAMTGGQMVEGHPTVPQITRQLHAEGVTRIFVVAEDPDNYPQNAEFASGVTVRHRSQLIAVEKELREIKGVTALVYDQTCAAEKRRRRKRGQFPDPPKRTFINDLVCEGCGDCSVKSNCISVEPLETEFGRKRIINQSSCNKDYTCQEGHCPSFVTVENATLRKRRTAFPAREYSAIPEPQTELTERPYNLIVTGVGGTGVLTVAAIVGMAAHLEGKACIILDSTGLAIKNGSVSSHIRLARSPNALHAAKIPFAQADCLLACDIVTAAAKDAMATLGQGRTRAVLNEHVTPHGEFVFNPDFDFDLPGLKQRITRAVGDGRVDVVNASRLAETLMGDAIATNFLMLGFAFQKGLVPIGRAAIEAAIALNGVGVEMNKAAFGWGRLAAHSPAEVEQQTGQAVANVPSRLTLEQEIDRRADFLVQYQDRAYSERYRKFVDHVLQAETQVAHGESSLTRTVVHAYFKLLAYKDEYEVARLYADPSYMDKLRATFEDGFHLKFHLAPPIGRDRQSGERVKRTFGPWMMPVFRILARLKFLRGTRFDVMGLQAERRMERALIVEYETIVHQLLAKLTRENHALATDIAALPEKMRGFGHVKEKNVGEVKLAQQKMLTEFFAKERGFDVVPLAFHTK